MKMVSDNVNPGCFMYNKTVAKAVLGTDDPDEVQQYINDRDGFFAVAEKAKKVLANSGPLLYNNKTRVRRSAGVLNGGGG